MASVIAETICVRRPVVLVVEDEPAQQDSLCAALEAASFTTLRAGSVEDAIVLFGRQQIDVVTLDVRLPDPGALDRSGLSLLAYLRSTPDFHQMPVIVLTGSPLDETEVELIRRHGAHLFYKPEPYSIVISQLRRELAELEACRHPR
jgi:CheY-like chemotaxis protein